jgi:hypothetical protein
MLGQFLDSLQSALFEWHTLEVAMAVGAFAFFGINKRRENAIAQMRVNNEKALNDARIIAAEEDNTFRRQSLEFERQRLEIERKRGEINTATLEVAHDLSNILGARIASELRLHCDWAAAALSQAGLAPNGRSIINQRSSHYHGEKLFLAEAFAPLLLARCRAYVENRIRVRLFIDSGSTLIPLIDQIARNSVRASKEDWIKSKLLELYTNNLAGAISFMEHGRETYEDPYSDVVLSMNILPGHPLATFAAVSGPETLKAISNMRSTATDDHHPHETVKIIAVITGNWVRARRSFPRIPVPLARGLGHLDVKQSIVNVADEIFVVAPLGKLGIGIATEDFNDLMDFELDSPVKARQSYSDLRIDVPTDPHRLDPYIVKLVTTSRPNPSFVLYNQSAKLLAHMNESNDDSKRGQDPGIITAIQTQDFASRGIRELPHLAFPFDKLDREWQAQLETELPHPHTRNERTKMRFFLIDTQLLAGLEEGLGLLVH